MTLLLASGLAFPFPSAAQVHGPDSARDDSRSGGLSSPASVIHVPHLTGPIELDGISDDPAWQDVEPIRLIAHTPNFGGEPSEPTEVMLGHDGRYLYVGARIYDSEPSLIQALTLKRNDGDLASDIFAFTLDTFNDRETAVVFGTTPTGTRTDLTISNDAHADSDLNFDWNTFWDVAVVQNGEGWFAEFRIPFSSLRFQDRSGHVTMGLSIWRWLARKQESATFPAISPRWGFNSVFKPSQMQRIVLEGVASTRPLYVTPYVLAGGDQSNVLNDAATAFRRTDTRANEIGLDAKYGLTDNLTLDVTVNPDFAQVEADDAQINLTRFSLFFPEKRLFFQERSSAFDFSLGGNDRLFHSRRIGLVNGERERIWGGARVVGRISDWDVAALNMQTGASQVLPSENFGVVRLRRKLLNENSHAGGIVTSRIGMDGAHNLAYGLDANLLVFNRDFVTLNWAQTFKSDVPAAGVLERAFFRGRWERRGTEGFGYALDASRAGAAFDPGVGFILRTDYTRLGERLYYGWRPGDGSTVFRHTLALNGVVYQRNRDGSTETAEIGPQWEIETRSGHTLTLGATSFYEDLPQDFALGEEVIVPADAYWAHNGLISYGMPSGLPLRTSASVEAGSFFDGYRTSIFLSPHWSVSRHLVLGGAYSLDRVVFPERDQRLNAHVARARAEVMLSTKLSLRTFIQYSSAGHAVTANARFRYNPREGRDLYVVYNHGIHTNRHRLEPFLPLTDSRTLLIKYSHALDLGF